MSDELDLEPFPDDWERALAVVAHPDDMEYGAASAVARWTAEGKRVDYVMVTSGEAGISSMPPDEVRGPREREQRASCDVVGVTDLEFLGLPDGLVVADLALRRAFTTVLRRYCPDVVLSINFRDSWGGPSWNHADHRAVGLGLLDAARDAANPWLFDDCGPAWAGIRMVAFGGSPRSTHAVDVTEHLDLGIESLRCHELYLSNLGDGTTDPDRFLRDAAASTGERLGCRYATGFELCVV